MSEWFQKEPVVPQTHTRWYMDPLVGGGGDAAPRSTHRPVMSDNNCTQSGWKRTALSAHTCLAADGSHSIMSAHRAGFNGILRVNGAYM